MNNRRTVKTTLCLHQVQWLTLKPQNMYLLLKCSIFVLVSQLLHLKHFLQPPLRIRFKLLNFIFFIFIHFFWILPRNKRDFLYFNNFNLFVLVFKISGCIISCLKCFVSFFFSFKMFNHQRDLARQWWFSVWFRITLETIQF